MTRLLPSPQSVICLSDDDSITEELFHNSSSDNSELEFENANCQEKLAKRPSKIFRDNLLSELEVKDNPVPSLKEPSAGKTPRNSIRKSTRSSASKGIPVLERVSSPAFEQHEPTVTKGDENIIVLFHFIKTYHFFIFFIHLFIYSIEYAASSIRRSQRTPRKPIRFDTTDSEVF